MSPALAKCRGLVRKRDSVTPPSVEYLVELTMILHHDNTKRTIG
jgi:hypothetical protein